MQNKIFIVNQIEKIKRGDYSDFLYPNELEVIKSLLNKEHIKYKIFNLFNDEEKSIIYTSKIPSVSLLEIITDNKLNHKDILGSLFSHNINVSKYGDIIISDKYFLPVLDVIKPYLLANLNKIGNNFVKLKEVDISLIKDYKYEYEEIQIIVSSLRLDNVVSILINSSRNKVDELFKNKYVFVNYSSEHKKTYTLRENDIIGIRRNGKYKFLSILRKTNSNKQIIRLLKYK